MRRTSRCTGSVVAALLAGAGLLGGPSVAGAQPEHARHRAHGHDAGRHMEHRFDDPELVLIVNTYHHIPERVAYFTALRNHLAPGGRIAIIDPRKGAPGGGPPDEFRFTPEEIGTELGSADFELLSRQDFLPRQHFLVFGMQRPVG